MRTAATRRLSCGVIITDGARLVLGHATRSPRWDVPKGVAEPGETALDAALRELWEETGLRAAPAALHPLGTHGYLPAKDLALFAWAPVSLPDPAALVCRSMITRPGAPSLPELDRFGVFAWEAGLALVGRNMARVLAAVWPVVVEWVGVSGGR